MDNRSSKRYATTTVVAMCCMVTFAAGIAWNTFPLFATPIIEEFGCLRTEFTVGITLVNVVNALISMFFYGRMVERLGMRNYTLLCTVVAILAFVSFALAQNVYFIWLGGALFGFGSAGLSINTINVIVDRWFKKSQGKLVGIPQTCSAVAGIVFASVWAYLIAELGWRLPFWIICACGLLTMVLIGVLYKGDPKDLGVEPMYADEVADEAGTDDFMDDDGGIAYKDLFKTRQFWLMAVAYLCNGLLAFAIMSNLALFAFDFGFGEQVGFVLSVALVAQAVSFLVAGPIIDRFGSKWCVLVSLVLLSAGCLMFATESLSLVTLLVAAALVGFNSGAAQMPMGASVREAFGRREFSKKMGTVTSFTLFGFAFGPSVLSVFYDVMGTYQAGLYVMVVIAAFAAALMFAATKRVENRPVVPQVAFEAE